MSALELALGLVTTQEHGGVRIEVLLSTPLLSVEVSADAGPHLILEEAATTLVLRFLDLHDLLAFQHNLAHLAIPGDPGR